MLKLNLQFFGGRGAKSASSSTPASTPTNNADGVPFRKGKEATPEEAGMNVNVDHYNSTAVGNWVYRENCQRCVWAYEMQRRGYDVEALPTYKGDNLPSYGNWMGIAESNLTREYVGQQWGQTNSIKTEVSNATTVMGQWGEGSRGIMRVRWSGSRTGHVFNVEYKNGKITAYDAQTGKSYTALKDALKGTARGYTQLIRSDDVTFKTSEVSKYVKERGK